MHCVLQASCLISKEASNPLCIAASVAARCVQSAQPGKSLSAFFLCHGEYASWLWQHYFEVKIEHSDQIIQALVGFKPFIPEES